MDALINLQTYKLIYWDNNTMKPVRFTIDLNEDFHTKLKVWCTKHKISMKSVIIQLISEFLYKQETEQK